MYTATTKQIKLAAGYMDSRKNLGFGWVKSVLLRFVFPFFVIRKVTQITLTSEFLLIFKSLVPYVRTQPKLIGNDQSYIQSTPHIQTSFL